MWHVDNRGENNPAYKGDGEEGAGYSAIHSWVRRRKIKPDLCERCGLVPPCDLANKSGLYQRSIEDYEYLCRKCHMDSDGRNDQLRESGRSRKLPDKICLNCKISFHTDNARKKFCSRECWKKSCYGRVVTTETREKIRAALLGHEVSEETKTKISNTKRGA